MLITPVIVDNSILICLSNEATPYWMFPVIQLNSQLEALKFCNSVLKAVEQMGAHVPGCIEKEFKDLV